MAKLSAEEVMDVNILLAMNKCMGEMAHTLQYKHTQQVKQRIKHVIRTVDLYEREIDKILRRSIGSQEAVESIYDSIMDLILEAKEIALKNYNNGNTTPDERKNDDSSSKKT